MTPLFTSNFASVRYFPPTILPVSIARWPPHWYRGARYAPLYPPADLLLKAKVEGGMPWSEYVERYFHGHLAKLSPEIVHAALVGMAARISTPPPAVALLCYEGRDDPHCHRRLVAAWLVKELGEEAVGEVREWRPAAGAGRMAAGQAVSPPSPARPPPASSPRTPSRRPPP